MLVGYMITANLVGYLSSHIQLAGSNLRARGTIARSLTSAQIVLLKMALNFLIFLCGMDFTGVKPVTGVIFSLYAT